VRNLPTGINLKNTHPFSAPIKASVALLIGSLALPNGYAHTTSVGYENAGPGSVTFWYGTYHNPTSYTEGSLLVVGTHGYSSTVTFTTLVSAKPTGLIDGTTNFYSDGTALTGTPTTTIENWQGATFTGLSPDTYTFTYQPISSPTSTWRPTDSVILSSSVTLTATDLGGGLYVPRSNHITGGAATVWTPCLARPPVS
jgi:fibronectin-binding autotransporter adhesin